MGAPALGAFLALGVALAGCGAETGEGEGARPPVADGPPTVRVADAFALDPMGAEQMAVYATLVNGGPAADTLLGIASPVAGSGSLHAMLLEEGMMRMRPLTAIELPPSDTVRLRPGGLHGMLEELADPPTSGDTIEVTLRFLHAPPVTVRTPVRDPADVVGGA